MRTARFPQALLLALCTALAGCGGETGGTADGGVADAGARDAGNDSGVLDGGNDDAGSPLDAGAPFDTSVAALAAFGPSGKYKSWKSDPVHTSTGPHGGTVKVFVNDLLYTSLKAGNSVHPAGSVAVKELLGGATTPQGWAIDVKDTDGGWVFYETNGANPFYFRGDSNFCANCHRPGKDFYLSLVSNLP